MSGTGRGGRGEFRRLRRSELWLMLIPASLGVAAAVVWLPPPGAAVAAVVLAVGIGLGSAFLPAPARQIVVWVVGIGGALGWGLQWPALALAWLLLFPCGAALGSHVRAVRSTAGVSSATRRRQGRDQ